MVAARLRRGRLALYSPVPKPDDTALEAARDLGGVTTILAPSHFHHLGIADWRAAFPDATVCAPAAAIPRLENRLGHSVFDTMPDLDRGLSLMSPPGLRAAEVWLRAEGPDGVAWAVCDAFAGPAGSEDSPADSPKARGAFATMCLGDKTAYKNWAMTRIDADRPVLLLPAHGNAVSGPALADGLAAIVEAL
ncbi:hypothetical protein KIN_28030 [Litoreibacter roseus]|uniref:DUF4336 domain-containing protein n=2 Tax=Litoreibacter roseus TaxID=2601869 RepID=A0A6N6JJW5_9RHOB|nr:hypothetical protein KIN_28030 [Litoreibacter roseus]